MTQSGRMGWDGTERGEGRVCEREGEGVGRVCEREGVEREGVEREGVEREVRGGGTHSA